MLWMLALAAVLAVFYGLAIHSTLKAALSSLHTYLFSRTLVGICFSRADRLRRAGAGIVRQAALAHGGLRAAFLVRALGLRPGSASQGAGGAVSVLADDAVPRGAACAPRFLVASG